MLAEFNREGYNAGDFYEYQKTSLGCQAPGADSTGRIGSIQKTRVSWNKHANDLR